MRVASSHIFNIADRNMAKVNRQVVDTQEQISTGQRVLTPADDPVAAVKILQITHSLAQTEQFRKNIDIAENSLGLEESALASISTLLQRTQELAVKSANTATLTREDYSILASEVDEHLKELVNLLNTKNANGDFIFGGYQSASAPFVGEASSGFRYAGDEGQQFIQIAPNTRVAATDSGLNTFVKVPSESKTFNTYPGPDNRSEPPAAINVGRVYDQAIYDDFYPRDLVITFNPDNSVSPPRKNFTITERETQRVLVANEIYVPGEEIRIQGAAVRISGAPISGEPAVPSEWVFGAEQAPLFPVTLAPPGQTLRLQVGEQTGTLTLSGTFNSLADLAAGLNDSATGNAATLERLGLSADAQGIQQIQGLAFSLTKTSPAIAAMLGMTDADQGALIDNGQRARPGDRFLMDSSDKQDVLTTLARFSESMKSYTGDTQSRQALSDQIAATLANLDNAQTRVSNTTASIGARLNTLESTRGLHIDIDLVGKAVLSDIRDLDYAEASTRLAQQTLILQATQQSFIRVSQLTLFAQL
jgi:flagellar hook-associated protein 3 FlgL